MSVTAFLTATDVDGSSGVLYVVIDAQIEKSAVLIAGRPA